MRIGSPKLWIPIGGLTVALMVWLGPLFCNNCFFVDDVILDGNFKTTGFDPDDVADLFVLADESIKPDSLLVEVSAEGKFESNMLGTLDPVGFVQFVDPDVFKHGEIRHFRGLTFKIPLLDLSIGEIVSIAKDHLRLRENHIDLILRCGSPCTVETLSATIKISSPAGGIFDADGRSMLEYFARQAQGAFLDKNKSLEDGPAIDDFVRFLAYETKSVLNPCAYGLLSLTYRQEAYVEQRWNEINNPWLRRAGTYASAYKNNYCDYTLDRLTEIAHGVYDEPRLIMSDPQAPGFLQYEIVAAFAAWKAGSEYAVDSLLWVDAQVCKREPDVSRVGDLQRYPLVKSGKISANLHSDCPLIPSSRYFGDSRVGPTTCRSGKC